MVVHLLQNLATADQSLVAVAEIIKHRIMVIGEQQQIRLLPCVFDFEAIGIDQICKRQFTNQHRLAS
ncbi:hypothetical protein D3C76_1715330 [compost metagenome]